MIGIFINLWTQLLLCGKAVHFPNQIITRDGANLLTRAGDNVSWR